jgi:uncharacterized membrane protein (DUF2068 family)
LRRNFGRRQTRFDCGSHTKVSGGFEFYETASSLHSHAGKELVGMTTALQTRKVDPPQHHRWLEFIGVLKLVKGAFFVALGFGLLRMLHHDLYLFALETVSALHLDPDRQAIAMLLDKVTLLNDHRLKQLSAVVFIYAGLDFVEGIGLVLEKRWAEYFTLILTVALLPLEAFKLVRHPNHWTVVLLLANILIAIYLAWLVLPKRASEEAATGRQTPPRNR